VYIGRKFHRFAFSPLEVHPHNKSVADVRTSAYGCFDMVLLRRHALAVANRCILVVGQFFTDVRADKLVVALDCDFVVIHQPSEDEDTLATQIFVIGNEGRLVEIVNIR
jgi:hypothetical protein